MSSSVSSISMGLKGQIASELTSTLSFTMDVSPQFVTGESLVTNCIVLCSFSNLLLFVSLDIDLLENKDRQLFVVEMPQGNDEETFRAHGM